MTMDKEIQIFVIKGTYYKHGMSSNVSFVNGICKEKEIIEALKTGWVNIKTPSLRKSLYSYLIQCKSIGL